MVSVIDLHCDLLSYLMGSPERTPDDLEVRCAIPQLRQGHVKLQVLAIFTQTGHHSSEKGLAQAKIYHTLPIHYPQEFIHFTLPWNMQSFPIVSVQGGRGETYRPTVDPVPPTYEIIAAFKRKILEVTDRHE